MNELKFSPFPRLETERLLLRELQDSDESALFALRSDERVNRYIGRPAPKETAEVRAFIEKIRDGVSRNENLYWAITLNVDPALIGTICLWNFSADKKNGELGYELFPGFQGKGIMNEAIGRVIRFAFDELNMEHLEAFTHRDNEASARLLRRYGFQWKSERKDEWNADNLVFVLQNESS